MELPVVPDRVPAAESVLAAIESTATPGEMPYLPDTFRSSSALAQADEQAGGTGAVALAAPLAVALSVLRGVAGAVEDWRQRRKDAHSESASLREAMMQAQVAEVQQRSEHTLAMRKLAGQLKEARAKASSPADSGKAGGSTAGGGGGSPGRGAGGRSTGSPTSPVGPSGTSKTDKHGSGKHDPPSRRKDGKTGPGAAQDGKGKGGKDKTSSGGSDGKKPGGSGAGADGASGGKETSPAERARGRQERAAARQSARNDRRAAKQAAGLADRSKDRDSKRQERDQRRAEKRQKAKDDADRVTLTKALTDAVVAEAQRRLDERRENPEPVIRKNKAREDEEDETPEPSPSTADGDDDTGSDDTEEAEEADTGSDDTEEAEEADSDADDTEEAEEADSDADDTEEAEEADSERSEDGPPPREDADESARRAAGPLYDPFLWMRDDEEPGQATRAPAGPAPLTTGQRALPSAPEKYTQRPGTTKDQPTAPPTPPAPSVPTTKDTGSRVPAQAPAPTKEHRMSKNTVEVRQSHGLATRHQTGITLQRFLLGMARISLSLDDPHQEAEETADHMRAVVRNIKSLTAILRDDDNITDPKLLAYLADLAEKADDLRHWADRLADDCESAANEAYFAAKAVNADYGRDKRIKEDVGLLHVSAATHHDGSEGEGDIA